MSFPGNWFYDRPPKRKDIKEERDYETKTSVA